MPTLLHKALTQSGVQQSNIRYYRVQQQTNDFDCGPYTVLNLFDLSQCSRPVQHNRASNIAIENQRQHLAEIRNLGIVVDPDIRLKPMKKIIIVC